ncbi:hypothetical protein OSB04_011813 [Centaurea solstitialis]|uniref:CCHC-type domain-containing protein n=1 Tax=Centaurea solstitialis TaxID=347529 RepID=A0AA38TBW9_9ASTR|nr:hypothetical protein OSB04_011813 [Centaurea solstitialis]
MASTVTSTNNLSLQSILEKDKLTGSNFLDWERNLMIVLRHERKWYVLEEPLGEAPPANAPAAARNAHKKHSDDLLDVACLMLATMSPDLQAGLINTNAYDMIRQLRDMFQTQARTERYDATKAFNECKMVRGTSVSDHVMKMKRHLDHLERLGHPVPLQLATDTILNSLSEDYRPFVVNYNMNNMEKTIAELHSMLKTAELNMGNKNKTKDVLMVKDGGVKKKNGQASTSKGKGPVQAIQSAPKKGKGKGKGKKVKPNKARTENRCFICNEIGHWRQNCPKRHEAGRNHSSTQQLRKVAVLHIQELEVSPGSYDQLLNNSYKCCRLKVTQIFDRVANIGRDPWLRLLLGNSHKKISQCYTDNMDTGNFRLMTQDLVKLDSFDGSNYTRWADKVKFMLMVLNLAHVMDVNLEPIPENPIPEAGKQPDQMVIADLEKKRLLRKEAENLACGHIKNALSDRLYDLYAPIRCPRELWKALEHKYKAQEEGTNKYLVSKYLRFQMVDDKPILEQIHELQVLVNKMNSLSITIPEIFQVGEILDKLPPSWKDFSKRMMHKSEDYSLDDMLKHLRIEEEARNRDKKSRNPVNVNSVQAGGKNKGKLNSGGPSKKNGKCHVCGETGHYARECKQRKSGPSGGPSAATNAVGDIGALVANLTMDEINMMNVTPQAHLVNQDKDSWYLDTGATAHVCDDKSKFVNYQEIHGKQVSTANGGRADIAGSGTILLHFTSGRSLTLNSVLHVPTITKNLLSYSKLDSHGFAMRGSDGTIVFTKNDHYIGKASLSRGMYALSLQGSNPGSKRKAGGHVGENGSNLVIFDAVYDTDCSSDSVFVCGSDDDMVFENDVIVGNINEVFFNYSVWRKPDLSYFRVWGCITYYRTPDPKRSKLGARAIKSIFVGYAINSNGYAINMLIIETSLVGILETKNYLSSNFKMKDLGEVDTILGIKVKRSESQISLSQTHYIEKILTKFQHLNIKEFNSPFDSSVKLEKNSGRVVAQLEYASAIGCMMYAMHCTRTNIAFAVGKLSQFTCNPGSDHWKAIGRVLGYLKRTSDLELTYNTHSGILEGYSDSSWIDNSSDSKSTSGWIFTLAGGAISWASKKQTCIAHSTMEAEFIALAVAGKEAEWIRDILTDLHFWPHPTPSIPMCYTDNMDTGNFRLMTQDLVKLDSFDGSNYTRWADNVKFMLMVLNLAHVMDVNLEPIPENPIPEAGKQPDQKVIADLEKKRLLRKEAENLACGHIKNALSDRLYDLYAPITCPRELWKALEHKYKAQEEGTNKYLVSKYLRFQMVDDKPILEQIHELQVLVNKMNSLSITIPEIFQLGAILDKLPPSWKDFSKRMMHKSEDYSLDDMLKHLRIEEEARNRDKKSRNPVNVNSVQAGGKKKGKLNSGGPSKSGIWVHTKRLSRDRVNQAFRKRILRGMGNVTSAERRDIMLGNASKESLGHRVGHRQQPMQWVSTANGGRADIAGSGTILLHFTSGRSLTLNSVLHVPTITKNLLSYSKLDSHGFAIRGSDGTIVFTKNDHYIGKASLSRGMYALSLQGSNPGSKRKVGGHVGENGSNLVILDAVYDIDSSSDSVFVCGSDDDLVFENDVIVGNINEVFFNYSVCSISLWHKRLAHTNIKNLEKMHNKEDAENSDRTLAPSLPGTSHDSSKTSQKVDEPRRSTRVRKGKSLGDDFLSYLVEGTRKKMTREVIFSINIDDDPKTFEEAMSSRDA